MATDLKAQAARIAELEALVAAKDAKLAEIEAKKAAQGKLSCKLSVTTGIVSLYGMGRFPVSLYREQWERLFSEAQSVVDGFLNDSDIMACMASKDDTAETKHAKQLRREGMHKAGDPRFSLAKQVA